MSSQNKIVLALKMMVPLAIVLIVLRLSGCFTGQEQTKTVVKEMTVRKGDLVTSVTATGEVKPQNRLEIKPPVGGRIDEVLVREGNMVEKGNILAWMSSTDRVVLLDAIALKEKGNNQKLESDLYKPTPLLAPIAGMVIVRNVEPGQTLTVSDVALVLADRLIVKAQVDETDVGLVKVGQKAHMRLDASTLR